MAERHPTTGALVWRLANRWRAAVDRAVAPLGLTHAQYVVLATLRSLTTDGEQPSQRRLAEVSGLETIYVSKLVSALDRNGLVARQPDPGDARAVRLTLTERGVEVIDGAVAVVSDLHHELLAVVGGPESRPARDLRATLQALLDSTPATPSDESRDTGDEP
jgi:DNA-binding MarR family transcriptional regulator